MPFDFSRDCHAIVMFGEGDIQVSLGYVPAEGPGNTELVLSEVEFGPDGRPVLDHDDKNTDDLDEVVRLCFESPKSLAAFIVQANRLLAEMLGYEGLPCNPVAT